MANKTKNRMHRTDSKTFLFNHLWWDYICPKKTVRRSFLFLALTHFFLIACTGGTGSGDNESVTGTDLSISFQTAELEIPIFYVKRTIPQDPLSLETPYAFNAGAQLYARVSASISSPEINITARIHGDNNTYDVKDLEISPDGKRLLFAMHPPIIDLDNIVETWDIWEYNLETDNLRRVISDTFIAVNGQGHDFAPSYLPLPNPLNSNEIAIVFSSTRQETNRTLLVNELKSSYSGLTEASARNDRDPDDGAMPISSLHVYDESLPESDQLRQITFNQSHDIDSLVLPSGIILFTRRDNINNRDVFSLYQTTPTGTKTELIYGYHSGVSAGTDGQEALITDMQALDNGQLLGLLRQRDLDPQILGGAIVKLDIENYIDQNTPTFNNSGLLNPAFEFVSNSNVLTDDRLSLGGRFSSVKQLNDNSERLLVSWTPCLDPTSQTTLCTNTSAPENTTLLYGIWLIDNAKNIFQPIISGAPGFMYTDVAIAETHTAALSVAAEPISLTDGNNNQRAILNIKSIYDIDGVDTAVPDISTLADPSLTDPATIQQKFLRLVKAVSIPDESEHEFDNSAFGINSSQLMREIVGYLPIEPDGSVRGLIPANIPLMIDIVDAEGKRIGGRHQNWLTLGANETYECIGCHTVNSTEPHGRVSAQPLSINPGAPPPGIFPNTEQSLGETGLTMAESYARYILIDPAPEPRERQPVSDLSYIDEWTDDSGSLSKAPSFTISYDTLTTTTNPENPFCKPTWTPLCRIVINYETHIQPIWEATRTAVDDGSGTIPSVMVDSCIGCHTTDSTSRIPAGQLDLTSTTSDIDNDHFTSYRELFNNDNEQGLAGGTTADRNYQCQIGVDLMNDPIFEITQPTVSPAMNRNGANSSSLFFDCLTNDNIGDSICRSNVGATIDPNPPNNCIELGGDPLASEPIINHNGMLSPEELRLISEWLDLGAQYYNNPFDAPTP